MKVKHFTDWYFICEIDECWDHITQAVHAVGLAIIVRVLFDMFACFLK